MGINTLTINDIHSQQNLNKPKEKLRDHRHPFVDFSFGERFVEKIFINFKTVCNMTIQDVKQIKLADYLQSLGYTPVKQQGRNLWYKSPLREETDASFKVNTELEKWYDFGIGKGGNIIALAAELYRSEDVAYLLRRIEERTAYIRPASFSFGRQHSDNQPYQGLKVGELSSPAYECRQTLFCHRLSEHGRRI